jgi:hypothetical protein
LGTPQIRGQPINPEKYDADTDLYLLLWFITAGEKLNKDTISCPRKKGGHI